MQRLGRPASQFVSQVCGGYRFFCRDFFAFDDELCSNLGIDVWEVVLAQIERGPHHLTAIHGDTPATGPRDFGDQAVSVEAVKGTADLRALLSVILAARSQMKPRLKLCADIAIGETSQAVLAVHEALK